MKTMMKLLASLMALMLCCAPALAESAADDSLAYIQNKGELILGLDPTFAPMGFTDENGEIVGYDIDVAAEVCARLGVTLMCQPIDWTAKEMELNAKNIDCIWNGMSISDDRLASMSISVPYMSNAMILVTRADSGIETKADLKGKKLGLQGGSTAEEALDGDADFKASLGEVVPFEFNAVALMDLRQGGVDAVLMDLVAANYYIATEKADLVCLDETLLPEEYGIGFRKTDAALTEAVNNALFDMVKDGTLAQITEKWFGTDISCVKDALPAE